MQRSIVALAAVFTGVSVFFVTLSTIASTVGDKISGLGPVMLTLIVALTASIASALALMRFADSRCKPSLEKQRMVEELAETRKTDGSVEKRKENEDPCKNMPRFPG